jgi:hypothetical protein
MRRKIGIICVLFGVICIFCSIGFVVYNYLEEKNAEKATKDADGNVITATYATQTTVNGIDTRVEALERDDYIYSGNFLIIDGGTSTDVIDD